MAASIIYQSTATQQVKLTVLVLTVVYVVLLYQVMKLDPYLLGQIKGMHTTNSYSTDWMLNVLLIIYYYYSNNYNNNLQ